MIKALKGSVVIKELPSELETPNGILKTTSEEKNMTGVVTDSSFKDIQVGMVIVFGRYTGKPIELEGVTYRTIKGDDIMGIEKDGEIYPVSDWILAEVMEGSLSKLKSKSIILLNSKKEADSYNKAKVLAVGPGKFFKSGKHCPMTVKEGDHIIYGPYSSYGLKVWGRELTMLKENVVEMILGLGGLK